MDRQLTREEIKSYREQGFAIVRGSISATEVARYLEAANRVVQDSENYRKDSILNQWVNVWRLDCVLKELTLHPQIASFAEQLAEAPLRLWHDQLLIKNPNSRAPTEFHQDQPYWPLENARESITAWVALADVPVERGCMCFLPGSHQKKTLPRQELNDKNSLFNVCPGLRWLPRVTVPLRAGDCTFHHGRTAHYAHGNETDQYRIAHAIIFTDLETRFSGASHVVTRPLDLERGQTLPDDYFPPVTEFQSFQEPLIKR